ncbi:sulfotransferase family protein [Azospirillum sp. B506]|uniref:sulfotransferase family protein n=1 Tax=Azospirillum sp. B506 TaxID=137721 RepID=UPI0005B287F1|nr:sulfotransferase family protein [Azospirillum sp. B506]
MDRAGTSLCTDILHTLGVELSEDLLPPHPDNPNGYFEARLVMEAHERAFLALGFQWKDISALKPLPPAWWRLPAMRQAKAELSTLVAAEIAKGHKVWGFKDPRTARLLPLWKEIFHELGVRPQYVLAVRHPRGVMQSLAKRDGLPLEQSELLWVERYTNALSYVGSEIKAVVHFEDWFTRPLEQAMHLIDVLSLPWGGDDIDLTEAVQAKVVREFRHDEERQEPQLRLPITEQLYQAMRSAPLASDWRESLTRVARQARMVLANSRAIVHFAQQQMEKRISELTAAIGERDNALAAHGARIAALTAALGERDSALATQGASVAALTAAVSERDSALATYGARIAALTAALGDRDAQISGLLQGAKDAPIMAK